MSLQRTCCCDYMYLRPCFFTTGSIIRMSISDFNTCGFDSSKTYRYTSGGTDFCGAWYSSSASFDSTSTTCSDFSLPYDDCCECLEDVGFPPTCCGWEDCMDYRYNNSLGPGLNITGYSGGGALVVSSNAGVNQYKWKVNSVSAGNYALVWTGSAYKVTFDLSIEYSVWNYLSSSQITCDGSAIPTNNWSWTWTETKSYEAFCPQGTFSLGLTDQGGDCRGDLICSGDVEDGQTFIGTVCDRWVGTGSSGSGTSTYQSDSLCNQSGGFSATIPISVNPQRFLPVGTNPCCSGFDASGTLDQIWINAQTTATQDITITGVWA